VNKARNLVVACYWAETLHKYTTDGSLERNKRAEIRCDVSEHVSSCLSTDDYAVSQQKSPAVVCAVEADGQVVCSYGPSQPSDSTRGR